MRQFQFDSLQSKEESEWVGKKVRMEFGGGFKYQRSVREQKQMVEEGADQVDEFEGILPSQVQKENFQIQTFQEIQSQQSSEFVRQEFLGNCQLNDFFHCLSSQQSLTFAQLMRGRYEQQRHLCGKPLEPRIKTQSKYEIVSKQVQPLQIIQETIQEEPEKPKPAKKVSREVRPFNLSKSSGGIRTQQIIKYVLEREHQFVSALNYQFKAKQVPQQVKDRDLYKRKLQQQQQARKQRIKILSEQQMKNVQTFHFLDRPQKIRITPEEFYKNDYQFHARSIPSSHRQPAIPPRPKGSGTESKLPARMEKAAKLKQAATHMQMQSQAQYYKYSFKPQISKTIPDFDRLHRNEFNRAALFKTHKETLPNPPALSQSKGLSHLNCAGFSHSTPQPKVERRVSRAKDSQLMSKSTAKHEALVELRRKQTQENLQKKRAETELSQQLKRLSQQGLIKLRKKNNTQNPTVHTKIHPQTVPQTLMIDDTLEEVVIGEAGTDIGWQRSDMFATILG